jgi:hypothetical protein
VVVGKKTGGAEGGHGAGRLTRGTNIKILICVHKLSRFSYCCGGRQKYRWYRSCCSTSLLTITHTHTNAHTHTHAHTHAHTHTCTHTHTQMHTHTCTHTCTHAHMYTHSSWRPNALGSGTRVWCSGGVGFAEAACALGGYNWCVFVCVGVCVCLFVLNNLCVCCTVESCDLCV